MNKGQAAPAKLEDAITRVGFVYLARPRMLTDVAALGSVALPNVTISVPFKSVDELGGTPPMVVDGT